MTAASAAAYYDGDFRQQKQIEDSQRAGQVEAEGKNEAESLGIPVSLTLVQRHWQDFNVGPPGSDDPASADRNARHLGLPSTLATVSYGRQEALTGGFEGLIAWKGNHVTDEGETLGDMLARAMKHTDDRILTRVKRMKLELAYAVEACDQREKAAWIKHNLQNEREVAMEAKEVI